jgi:hypothetical protein
MRMFFRQMRLLKQHQFMQILLAGMFAAWYESRQASRSLRRFKLLHQ